MNTLSLEHGRPLAFIKGGKYDKETLHIDTDVEKKKPEKEIDSDQTAILIENLYRSMGSQLSFRKMELLRDSIHNNTRPVNRELAQFFDHAKKLMSSNIDKEVVLDDAEFVPMFDTKQERSVFMVCGMSGSGKSTYTAHLCKTYHQQYPKNKIILFSNKSEDPVFDRLSYIDRIIISDDLLTDPITLKELKDTLVLFDDIECNPSKDIAKELIRISDLILQQGRSFRCSFVYISHQSNNYKATRNILNECHHVVVFPAMTTRYSLNYLFGKYFGFNKEVISKICKLPSRWVQITKSPPCVLYKTGSFIPDC
jgi:energy-coupling factor transporter ATP-binding protein EcfA2